MGIDQPHELVQGLAQKIGIPADQLEGLIGQISTEAVDKASRSIGAKVGLSGQAVFGLVQACTPKTQRLFLTAVTMGATKDAARIVDAIRRRDLK
jgi:hypothetical protein